MYNEICALCKEKNKTAEYDQLQRINKLVSTVLASNKTKECGRGIVFLWDIHAKCRYGIACPAREQYKQRCMCLARAIEDHIVALAVEGCDAKYHELLQLLRGYFPAVYNTVERLRARYYEKKCSA